MSNGLDDDMDGGDLEDLDGGDFEPEDDIDSDDVDSDLDGLDASDDLEEENESDNYSDVSVATAVRANPKRASTVRKKNSRVIEELFGDADISKADGQAAAWDRIQARMANITPKDWSLSVELHEFDVLDHKLFGKGFVIQLITPTKAEVLFHDGLKKLVCGLKR
jgi:hypothetical protein